MHGGQEGKQRLGTEEEKPQTSEVPVCGVESPTRSQNTEPFHWKKTQFYSDINIQR
jgi:hypothetical protein